MTGSLPFPTSQPFNKSKSSHPSPSSRELQTRSHLHCIALHISTLDPSPSHSKSGKVVIATFFTPLASFYTTRKRHPLPTTTRSSATYLYPILLVRSQVSPPSLHACKSIISHISHPKSPQTHPIPISASSRSTRSSDTQRNLTCPSRPFLVDRTTHIAHLMHVPDRHPGNRYRALG